MLHGFPPPQKDNFLLPLASTKELLCLHLQLGAEVGMGNRDRFVRPLALCFSKQSGNAEFAEHVVGKAMGNTVLLNEKE